MAIATGQGGGGVIVVRCWIRATCARAVVTDHPSIGCIGIVVASTGDQTAGHLIGVAHPIAIRVQQAGAIAVQTGGRRISAAAVIAIGRGIVVTGVRIGTAQVGTRTIVLVGPCIVIGRRFIHAAQVNTVGVGVGLGVVVVRFRIRATREDARAIIGIGRRIVVVGGRVDTTEVNAVGIHIGLGVVVVGLRVRATAELARAIIGICAGIIVVRCRIGAAEVFAEVIVGDERSGLVVVGCRVRTSSAGQVLTGAVLIGSAEVIAGHHVGTARHLKGIANAITIGIGHAIAIAVVFGRLKKVFGIGAGAVIGHCARVKVASRVVRTTQERTRSVVEGGVGVVIARFGVGATGHHTRAIVDRCQRIVVAGVGIGATGENAGAIVVRRIGVVILRTRNGTSHDHAGSVVEVGQGIKVLGVRVGATEENAGAVIGIGRGIVVESALIGTPTEQAAAVVHVCCSVVIVRSRFRAARCFARAVVIGGIGVVVVCTGIRTTASRSRRSSEVCRGETGRHPQVRGSVTVDEDLVVQRAADLPCRGELTEQHLLVGTGDTVGVNVGHKPSATRGVVHQNLTATVKSNDPILIGALRTLNGAFSSRGIGRAVDADGHPTVVSQVWE